MGVLDGKTALVTGSSRGIGRATALALGAAGAKVVVNYASDAAAAQSAVEAIIAAGSQAVAVRADTTRPEDIRRLFDEAEAAFGGLDIVINSAHRGSGRGSLSKVTEADIDGQLAVLKGFILCLQETARRIRDGGAVISISSGTARMARPESALYSSVKAAIDQLDRSLSRELEGRGVRVNTVAPGLTSTERVVNLPPAPGAPVPGTTPFSRPGTPEEIADVILFLVSPAARWINTQTIYATGGVTYSQ